MKFFLVEMLASQMAGQLAASLEKNPGGAARQGGAWNTPGQTGRGSDMLGKDGQQSWHYLTHP